MSRISFSTMCGAIVFAATLVGCGGGTDPDNAVNVAGQWSGTALFPNARGTQATLQQSGTAVSGQMSVNGAFVGRAVTGQVSAQNRTLTWAVLRDCELWGGVLNVGAAGDAMSGSVLIDGSGCQPARANVSGTLSLTRQ